MTVAIVSILVLTLAVWTFNQALGKKLPIRVCAICAGVTLTWIWLFVGMWQGYLSVPRYEFVTAILMGATIGGIVTELKKLFPKLWGRGGSTRTEELEKKMEDCC